MAGGSRGGNGGDGRGNDNGGENRKPEEIQTLPSVVVNDKETSARTEAESVAKRKSKRWWTREFKMSSFKASMEKVYSSVSDRMQEALETAIPDILNKPNMQRVNAARIMMKNQKEQTRMRRERLDAFGFSENGTGTGDKLRIARRKQLYGFKGGLLKDDVDKIFQGIKLTEGMGPIDTSLITESLEKAIQKNMFKMQTGGLLKNIVGPMTLYAGQPSLEKTRAQVNGLNEVLSKIRTAALDVLANIQDKEGVLGQYEQSGEARFHNGIITADSSDEAKATFAQLENAKSELRSILADIAAMNELVEINHGKVKGVLKDVYFLSPSLMKYNKMLQNLNAGLDYHGKVLKYQTRFGEVLGTAFERMKRAVAQSVQHLLQMINPFNLIKTAFKDFMSYDVKLQRTFNVIKYNLRAILRPAMSWIAQQLVNIIGLINAVIKGIGKAFGKDWDLFDQEAANTEKMREDLEAMKDITLPFDELHDIGGDSGNAANDLTGEIYKPEWDDLYDNIAAKAKALVEKLIPIFKKLGDILKWCLDHWKELLAAFITFKLVKGLLDLLAWARNVGLAFEGWNLLSFGKLLAALAAVAGAVLLIKSIIDGIDWGKNYFGMLPDERWEKYEENKKERNARWWFAWRWFRILDR